MFLLFLYVKCSTQLITIKPNTRLIILSCISSYTFDPCYHLFFEVLASEYVLNSGAKCFLSPLHNSKKWPFFWRVKHAHNPKQKHHNVIKFKKCYVKLFQSPRKAACISLVLTVIRLNFKWRIKSRLSFAGIIRSSQYSPRFQDKG